MPQSAPDQNPTTPDGRIDQTRIYSVGLLIDDRMTGTISNGTSVKVATMSEQTTARTTARRLLKPLFLRPVSPEERAVCDAVTEEIERLNRIIVDHRRIIGRKPPGANNDG
jgi:hypothetical protein